MEPIITKASFNDSILLDLHFLTHFAEWALDLICWELRISLRFEAAEEHLIQDSNGLQGDRKDCGHLVRLKPEPYIPVAPDGHVWSTTICHHMLLHSSCHSL